MDIPIAYGRMGATVRVPDENLIAVVDPAWPAVLPNPQGAVAAALRDPIVCASLASIVRARIDERCSLCLDSASEINWRDFSAVVLVSDITRPCPNRDILLPILAELRQARIPAECVTILIGTGLHRPVVGPETRDLLGDDVVSQYRVVNHFSRRQETLKSLGTTPSGTPVILAKLWVDADIRIATGVIEPHMMAGFSGGRKAICPGIAADETVRAWHSPKFLEHPNVLPGVLEGNPEHEEAVAVAAFAPPHFTVNVTVDRTKHLTGVFAGEISAVHAAGVASLREHVARPVAELSDILVTTNGGWPLDATYYQCQKGLLTGVPILKRGGTFLFAAACEDGLGQQEFTDQCMKYPTLDVFMREITAAGAGVTKDQWGLECLAKAARHAEIMFWSDRLAWKLQERMFVTPVHSLEDGLERAFQKHGRQARVAVMPHGPYVLPYLKM